MIKEEAIILAIGMLKIDEDFRADMYDDETGRPIKYEGEGRITIGFGWNLHTGISKEMACIMLEDKVRKEAVKDVFVLVPSVGELCAIRQAVLINMAYNMGRGSLSGFKNMLGALEQKDFELVAKEMLDSKWARKLKSRSDRLAAVMLTKTVEPYYGGLDEG